MSLRPPQNYAHGNLTKSSLDVLQYELMAERADSLGRAGLKAEAALARLAESNEEDKQTLIDAAADAVYWLFIQREMCGLRNGRDVIARYAIPGVVIARLGATSKNANK